MFGVCQGVVGELRGFLAALNLMNRDRNNTFSDSKWKTLCLHFFLFQIQKLVKIQTFGQNSKIWLKFKQARAEQFQAQGLAQ